ncbi:protein toll-like isoform X2 [Littorina saxatilis]|uniref:TIR domain-containing protein n=1 Tax=Littorina saxatilis TaxID=31220 RepID=A0AAN9C2K5_9CAEN
MGESTRSQRPVVSVGPTILLLFLLLLPTPILTFDLGSFLSALTGGGSGQSRQCPSQCNCTTPRAEELMQGYVSKYLPFMGVHMQPELESEARKVITIMTAWYGSMADIRCHLGPGERANITDLLQGSSLSFKSLKVTCDPGASVVWDVSAVNAFINVLDMQGCGLEKADNNTQMLAVPLNLWVLNLEAVLPVDVASLDLSTAYQLLALSVMHSNLTRVPQHWNNSVTPRLLYMGFAHNRLKRFFCEVAASQLTSLSLDHNDLTWLPPCLLGGSRYASHVSLRHNGLHSLKQLFANKTKNATLHAPPSIYHLDVSHNQISSLGALKNIHPLFGLDACHNYIASMTNDTFSLVPLLRWLDMSHNMLEEIPDGSFSSLVMLTHLNLSHNKLASFDFDQSPLSTKLVTIDVRHNRLIYPPYADTGYVAPPQSHIEAAANPFTCDCNIDVFLQFLGAAKKSRQSWFSLGYWDKSDSGVVLPYMDTNELKCSQPLDLKGAYLSFLSFEKACPVLHGCPAGCRCKLIKEGERHLSVNCSEVESITELPASVPMLPDTPIVLYFNQSGLKRLEHRPYLRQVKELHAGNSKVSVVTSGAIEALQNVSVLELHNNQLRSLPSLTKNLSLPAATNVTLGGNPWTCGCHDLWMPEWLHQHSTILFSPDEVRCRWTGKAVAKLSSEDLNCGVFNYLPLVIALSMLMGLALVVGSFLVRYRLEVLVFLYTRFRVRPFDLYKYDQARTYLFDVFVSFSQHDYRWVVEKLVDQLENRVWPYRLCIHLRDFPVGAPIADSVAWAVENSRCTMLVLTRDFLASEWCRHEFRAAHSRLLKDPQAKLLIVVHGPLDARILDREMMAYLRTHTYLRTEDKWFWSKLEYALPQPQEGVEMIGEVAGVGQLEAPPQEIDMDTYLPAAMAAGDVTTKLNGEAIPTAPVTVAAVTV